MIFSFTNIFSKLKLRRAARKAVFALQPAGAGQAAAAWPHGRMLALLLALLGLWLGFSFGTPSALHAAAQDGPPSLMGGITVITQAFNGTITSEAFPVADAGHTVTVTVTITGEADPGFYISTVTGCGGTEIVNNDQNVETFSYETGSLTEICTVTATFAPKGDCTSVTRVLQQGVDWFKVLEFIQPGTCTWEVPEGVAEVDYLIGGGGAGGFFEGRYTISSSAYSIEIGSGGGVSTGGGVRGGDGGNSNIFGISAGGGGGGGRSPSGTINGGAGLSNGGSGGGAGASASTSTGINGSGGSGNGNGSGGDGASNDTAENRGGGGASQGNSGQGTPGTGQDGPGGGGNAFNPQGLEDGKDGVVILRYETDAPADAPFYVSTWEELVNMRDDVTVNYVLRASLDSGSPGYAGRGDTWTPIGTDATPFQGTFDGNNFTISDLIVDRTGDDYNGLFGVVSGQAGVSVRDLTIENATITGGDFTGVLAGSFFNATAENVQITGSSEVTGVKNTGGVVGRLAAGTLLKSSSYASVTAEERVGGAVGWLDAGGSVVRSFAAGSTVAGTGDVGGLVGLAGTLTVISDSYSVVGSVEGPNDAGIASSIQGTGGLIGRVSSSEAFIVNTYAAGAVSSEGPVGGLIGRNEAASSSFKNFDYRVGIEQKIIEHPGQAGLLGFEGAPPIPVQPENVQDSFWDIYLSELGRPGSTQGSEGGIGLSTLVMMRQNSYTNTNEPTLEAAWNFDTTWNILDPDTDDGFVSYPFLQEAAPEADEQPGRMLFPFAGGAGTALSPFEIRNWEHLSNMRDHLLERYVLMEDLNESSAGYAALASAAADSDNGWLPIGDDSTPFSGIFDGDGNTIRDFVIDRDNTDDIGLFGVVRSGDFFGARIENLSIRNAKITGQDNVGALSGRIEGFGSGGTFRQAVVQDIHLESIELVARDVAGTLAGRSSLSMISGITGVQTDPADENLTDVMSSVEARKTTGGLLGYLLDGSLLESFAVVQLSANSEIDAGLSESGGLVGRMDGAAFVRESYTYANVDARAGGGDIGGLVGRMSSVSTIRDTFTLGEVQGPEHDISSSTTGTGGLVGRIDSENAMVFRSYAASSQLTADANLGGLVGVNAALPGAGIMTTPPLPGERPNVVNSFWDVLISKIGEPNSTDQSAGGTGKLTLDMKFDFTFTDTDEAGLSDPWNFDTVWDILEYDEAGDQLFISYPYLRELNPAATEEPGYEPYFYQSGLGTEDVPFRIANWRHLHFMNEFPEAFFSVVADVDQSSDFYSLYAASTSNDGSGWRPVGNETQPFLGVVAGNDHRISGFVSDRAGSIEVGLFGRLGANEEFQADIRDLIIANATVTGAEAVGGFAGFVAGTPAHAVVLENIRTEGVSVTGDEQMGGFAGLVTFSTLTNLATDYDLVTTPGDTLATVISAGSTAGGLLGDMNGGALERSYARAELGSTGGGGAMLFGGSGLTRAGGLIGHLRGEGTIETVFADVVIDGSEGEGDIGGLIGLASGLTAVTDAYTISRVTGPGEGTANTDFGTGGLIGRMLSTDIVVDKTYAATPVLEAAVNLGGLIGLNSELAGSVSGNHSGEMLSPGGPPLPVLPSSVQNSFWDARISGVGRPGETGNSFGGTARSTFEMKVEDNFTDTSAEGLSESWDFTADTGVWTILKRDTDNNFISYPYFQDDAVDPGFENEPGREEFPYADGFGTPQQPFTLENWRHLSNVRLNPDLYFELENDLNETLDDYGAFASADADGGSGWLPVATEALPFSGNFNGQDNTIADFVINRSGTNGVGLFGYMTAVNDSLPELFNFTIENASVTGADRVGMLAGYASSAAITLVEVLSGDVKADSRAGGLIGKMESGSLIEVSANTAISAADSDLSLAGGLVGRLSGMTEIKRAFTKGSVDASGGSGAVGGFIGRASNLAEIRDVYTLSDVSGPTPAGDGTGGLIGRIDHAQVRVINAYAAAALSGENAGGLVGSNITTTAGIPDLLRGDQAALRETSRAAQSGESGVAARRSRANSGNLVREPGSFMTSQPPFPGDYPNVFNSFWDVEKSGTGTADSPDGSEGGTGKSSRQMLNAVTYTNIDLSEGLEDLAWPFECFPASYTPDPGTPVWGISVPVSITGFDAVNDGYPHLKWEGHDETVIVNIGPVCFGTLQVAIDAINDGTQTEPAGTITVVVNGDQLVGSGEDIRINASGTGDADYDKVLLDFMPSRSFTIEEGGIFSLGDDHQLRLREDLIIRNTDSRLVLETCSELLADGSMKANITLSDEAILEVQPRVVLDIAPFFSTVRTTGDAFILLRNGALYRNTTDHPIELKVERQLGKEGEDDYSQFGWRMISSPVGTIYEDLFGGLVTQGFAGATFVDEEVYSPNVIWYDEEDGGTAFQSWRVPDGITATIPTGRGYFYYNFDGNTKPTGFETRYEDELPRTISTWGAEPVIESSGFDFGVTYTLRNSSLTEPTETDTVFIDYSTAESGWNLIGNPTASVLNWGLSSDANWTKTNMSNAIYIWDPLKEDFEVFNGIDMGDFDGRLAPYQGFWVQATDENPKLEFTNDAKIIESADFIGGDDAAPSSMGQPVDDPMILRFTIDAAGMQTRTWLMFSDEGRTGIDPMDAFRLEPMSDTWISASTAMQHGEPSLSINHLPARFEEQLSLPFYVGAAINSEPWSGELQLRWELSDNWPSNQQITLMDHERREAIRLTDGSQTVYDAQFSTPGSQMPPAYVNTMALFSPDNRYAFTANANANAGTAQSVDGSASAQRSSPNVSTSARKATTTATAPNSRAAMSGRSGTGSGSQQQTVAGIHRPSIVVGLPSRLVSASGRPAAETEGAVGTDGFGLQSGTSGGEGNLSGAIGDQEKPRFSIVIHPTSDEPTYIPLEVELYQNYPNPFNPSTTIRFALHEQQHVRIEVFDVLGRRVERLADSELGAGSHTISWDASGLASGIYFVRLATDTSGLTRGMTLIK